MFSKPFYNSLFFGQIFRVDLADYTGESSAKKTNKKTKNALHVFNIVFTANLKSWRGFWLLLPLAQGCTFASWLFYTGHFFKYSSYSSQHHAVNSTCSHWLQLIFSQLIQCVACALLVQHLLSLSHCSTDLEISGDNGKDSMPQNTLYLLTKELPISVTLKYLNYSCLCVLAFHFLCTDVWQI